MEEFGYITLVKEPTEWVSAMVVSCKKDKVRICIDPKDQNKVIKREHHPMKTIDEVISSIPSANLFSKLDAKSGFLQINLDQKSSYLTTFNTPTGRYRWLRLPFGIRSTPEIYQRIMDQMLEVVKGAFAIIDDILIAERDLEHHDRILKEVIYNDHKPLEQIFNKPVLSAPMRIQNILLNLQWYDIELRYRKGKETYISDTLSRKYIPDHTTEVNDIEVNDIEVRDMINRISVSKSRYAEIQELTP